MPDKPAFLGEKYSSSFQDASVARVYKHRPPYTPETFERLNALMVGTPRRVLDLGCGTGNVCRGLAPFVDEVDAIDVSPVMIDEGKRLENGRDPKIQWILGRVEEAPLRAPYAMATAGASLHWMDWDVLLPLLGRALNPGAHLVILHNDLGEVAWRDELKVLIPRYSINKEFQKLDMVAELQRRGRFVLAGKIVTTGIPFEQSADDYIEGFHSRSAFSRDRMTVESAAEFDAELRKAILKYQPASEPVRTENKTQIVWGRPQ